MAVLTIVSMITRTANGERLQVETYNHISRMTKANQYHQVKPTNTSPV